MRLPQHIRKAFEEFGRLGGKKGGPKGGKARAAKMSPEERKAAARRAIKARWAKVKAKKPS